jgi:hypothetical protein
MYSYIYLSQYSVREVNNDAKNLFYCQPDKGFWFVVVSPFTFDPALFAKLLNEKGQAVKYGKLTEEMVL